mgnify:CR=1 FL=1
MVSFSCACMTAFIYIIITVTFVRAAETRGNVDSYLSLDPSRFIEVNWAKFTKIDKLKERMICSKTEDYILPCSKTKYCIVPLVKRPTVILFLQLRWLPTVTVRFKYRSEPEKLDRSRVSFFYAKQFFKVWKPVLYL